MSEETKILRRRINISRGMKGGVSFEATVDATGYTLEETLELSKELVTALEERYPVPIYKVESKE